MEWKIVYDASTLSNLQFDKLLALDTETAKDKHLLGLSLSDGRRSCYIPVSVFKDGAFVEVLDPEFKAHLTRILSVGEFIGHNFTYDKRFIDGFFNIQTTWIADTRIMWHLASAPSGPRPYGLKDAQIEVLGWEKSNEGDLETEVKARGGSLKKGDHYLASLHTLARYACLDVLATYQLFTKLRGFFEEHDYWAQLEQSMDYNLLLERNTRLGVSVDRKGLQRAHERLLKKKQAASKRFLKLLAPEVAELEKDWADRKIAAYKREYNKVRYQNHPEEWERINLNSDKHKRELFFDKLGLPVSDTTDGGKPQTSADALQQSVRNSGAGGRIKEALESYLIYEKANTISSNFSGPYIEASVDGRLHPGFNICGTVSYRLSGFKPYLLNAPFDEKLILKNLKCDPGHMGVHADLSAIEPSITAHYSMDPSLLKVFRDGLGDIYLDLALELFPDNRRLVEGYNPLAPVTKAVKEEFARERKIAKVIQLAVQYTGTEYTVAKSLNRDGIPTTNSQAKEYVRAYWRKFHKVAQFNYRLRELNRAQGHLRNVIGRLLRVPDPDYKDLSNRFIQSSGHDVLVLWVLEIYRLCAERGIDIKPILLDCHDSTSNQCPTEQVDALKTTYLDALQNINAMLQLSVTIKAELKTFQSLAGLKGQE